MIITNHHHNHNHFCLAPLRLPGATSIQQSPEQSIQNHIN